MSFHGLPNKREYWSRFCRRHWALVEGLNSIAIAFTSPEHFEELLQSGVTGSNDASAELIAISEADWPAFDNFVAHFREDWQTYFVESLYPAYFREVGRRATLRAQGNI